jgi:hypothetical protein
MYTIPQVYRFMLKLLLTSERVNTRTQYPNNNFPHGNVDSQ